ncbi:hypothetical protein [uncultured Mediterranean phage uvMED]|nr:hypothetical protein [uncultured Mediterranean phage uvMED]
MIPSLLQIPSAVSDSKLHSVLPNNGKGDFTFDRSTGATRINRDALIEEVGYFSSELVQNGNFSELGSELVTNGDFATDSDWSKGTGWVIMNGYAESDGTNSALDQVSVLTIGKTYKVVITVTNMTASPLSVRLGTSSSNAVLSITENGTYTAYGVAGAATFRLRSQGFNGRIQNVSVKQVDPNDRWIKGSGWSYGNNKILGSNTDTFDTIVQDNIAVSGKQVKLTFDIVDYTSGTFRLFPSDRQDGLDQRYSGNGSYQVIYTPTVNNLRFQQQNFVGAVTNISLVEVQGDRPRLSYDITNGVVEDKPHLLLEPSSTNRITFSEDLSNNWTKANTTVTTNQITSPDGTLTADLVQSTSTSSCIIEPSGLSLTTGVTYTYSVFVKKGNNRWIRLGHISSSVTGCWFDLDNGAVGTVNSESATIEEFGNNWYRITNTFVATSTATANSAFIGICNDDGSFNSGVIGQNVYIWGAMVEQQTYATSYIPTAGTTITRAAETCNNSKPSVNSTEGVLYCETSALANDGTDRVITISDGTSSNRVTFFFSASNTINYNVYSGGSLQAFTAYTVSDITKTSKVAIKWKANDVALWVDGNEVQTDTSASAPIGLNQLHLATFSGVAVNFYGKVKGVAVYNEALSESQLMQLTGVTASSIYNNFVTRTASFTVEALNEVKKVIDNL